MRAVAAGLFAIAIVGAAALVQFRYDMILSAPNETIMRDRWTGAAAVCRGPRCLPVTVDVRQAPAQ